MRTVCTIPALAAFVLLAGCGGGSSGSGEESSGDASASAADGDVVAASEEAGSSEGGGKVVDQQPPGQAFASVDGLEFTFDSPGGIECSIEEEEFRFSYRIGDNEVTLGAGVNKYDELGFVGAIDLVVANPEGEPGPVHYQPVLDDAPDGALAFDGQSMSYSGPMRKQPANDGSQPEPVAVGNGTISATCP